MKYYNNRIFASHFPFKARMRYEASELKKRYDQSFLTLSWEGKDWSEKLRCDLSYRIIDVDCKAKILYNGFDPPKCWLLEPVFSDPQHIYKAEGNLCLYDPQKNEWGRVSHLYNTFIPWCLEWTVFQMIYEETGEWQHPERHPFGFNNSDLRAICEKYDVPFNLGI